MTSPLDQFDNQLIDGLEFCRRTFAYFEEVRAGPNGTQVLRDRPRPVKKLLEELLPISRYVLANYGPGRYLAIRWMKGNQAFDAELEMVAPFPVYSAWPRSSKIEVTQAVHPNEHLVRELLNAGGPVFGVEGIEKAKGAAGERQIVSKPTSYLNQSYIDTFAQLVLASINAKAVKRYPKGTILVVDCELHTLFLRHEWEEMTRRVRSAIPPHDFSEIFLTAGGPGYTGVL